MKVKLNRPAMSFVFESFDNNEVYDANFIKEINPKLFTGKNKATISIIQSQNIPQDQYVFASVSKNEYKRLSNDSVYKSRRVLIKKNWVDKNVPGFCSVVVEKPTYPPAPQMINLSENEKPKDKNGETIQIIVCGEYHVDKMFFRAKDVGIMLDLPNLTTILNDNHTSSFYENTHFVKFDVSKADFKQKQTAKNPIALFLTYQGLIRIIFTTRSEYSLQFQKWAIDILFTHQYGSKKRKIELANDLLETTNVKAIKSFLKTDVMSLPCIYLFELGKTKDLRKIFNIPDNHNDESVVYKYGLTNDLARRTSEHDLKYKKMGIKINLKHHAFIDCMYLQKAENDIRRYFTNMNYTINNADHTEVVSIPVQYTPQLFVDFKQTCDRYNGKLTEIKIHMERMQDKLESFEKFLQVKDDMLRRQDEMIDILKMKMK